MDLWGKITAVKGNRVVISLESAQELASLSLFTTEEQPQVVVNVQDERKLSVLQRKKAYALIAEIARWSGYIPEECKEWLKYYFTAETGTPYFSFSNADMTTAKEFITFLLDYAIRNHVPMKHSGLTYQDDLEAYMYSSLKYRSCVICGKHADVHHWVGSRIGMGNNRKSIDHSKRELMALCRIHHQELHQMGDVEFAARYHVKPIKLSYEELIRLGLMTKKQVEELSSEES